MRWSDPMQTAGQVECNRPDLARRLDFLLGGFGWCLMPKHLIADHLASGRLLSLGLTGELQRTPDLLTIYAAPMQNRSFGKAARWLLSDLTC